MKKRILIYMLLMVTGLSLSSCFMEKADKFAPKVQAAGTIQFVVPDGVLTGTAFAGVVQPTMDVVAARFAKAGAGANFIAPGNIVITANLSSNMTNLSILLYPASQTNPIRETKVTVTGITGTTTWTQPISTLLYAGNPVLSATTNYILEFVATNADGTQSVTRSFTMTILP